MPSGAGMLFRGVVLALLAAAATATTVVHSQRRAEAAVAAAGGVDRIPGVRLAAASPRKHLALVRYRQQRSQNSEAQKASKKEDVGFCWDCFIYWTSVMGSMLVLVYALHYYSNYCCEDDEADLDESDVPENLWALNLIAAVNQAKYGRFYVPALAIASLSVVMGMLQLFVLFLVVHDIDPYATPVTTVPTSPWVKNPWSVNCMKWIMVTFLGVFMVREAADFRILMESILITSPSRLTIPKACLMFLAAFQYVILMMIIWGGVTAVLSFQAVPDILYSSMSITFIAKVDDAFFTMVSQIFDIEADFTIVHGNLGRPERARPGEPTDAHYDFDADSPNSSDKAAQDLRSGRINSFWQVGLRFMVLLPVVFSVALIARAFSTNVMPSERLHVLRDWVMSTAA